MTSVRQLGHLILCSGPLLGWTFLTANIISVPHGFVKDYRTPAGYRMVFDTRGNNPQKKGANLGPDNARLETWKQIRAIVALPLTVTVLIPLLLMRLTRRTGARMRLPRALRAAGAPLAVAGLALMFTTIRLFAVRGRGTLAPWDPTERLVVDGVYRNVRNPMITGVACVLAGEALMMDSAPQFAWFLIFSTANAIYMPLAEEPGLEDRFGDEYGTYKENVPRWIPRLTPWTPPGGNGDA